MNAISENFIPKKPFFPNNWRKKGQTSRNWRIKRNKDKIFEKKLMEKK